MSSKVIGVKFINFADDRVFGDDRIGLMLERYLGYLECQSRGRSALPAPWAYSEKTYHYYSDVDVCVGDLVIVRGGSTMSLAEVATVNVREWVVRRLTRTVVAKIQLGRTAIGQLEYVADLLESQRRDKVLQKIVQRVKSCHHDQRNYLAEARQLAYCDSELATLLREYDSCD